VEPIFTLPYPEFCVAQQLARHLPASQGYSIYAPVSRQQPGVDLVLARRRGNRVKVACIQVKSSRTYSRRPPRRPPQSRTKRSFVYHTWFNNFECPPQADFLCLVTLYPAVDQRERRELGTWWAPQILLFTSGEMRRFLRSVKTVSGLRDGMFGFGFNHAEESFQTRGDMRRRQQSFTHHLLGARLKALRRFLSPEGGIDRGWRRRDNTGRRTRRRPAAQTVG
jgi:hypothetical protein